MEKINHPKHYNEHPAGIECIDVIEPFCFNLGSVIKYVWRAGLKPGEDDLDDLHKAEWFIKREIQRRERERLVSPKPKPQIDAEEVETAILRLKSHIINLRKLSICVNRISADAETDLALYQIGQLLTALDIKPQDGDGGGK